MARTSPPGRMRTRPPRGPGRGEHRRSRPTSRSRSSRHDARSGSRREARRTPRSSRARRRSPGRTGRRSGARSSTPGRSRCWRRQQEEPGDRRRLDPDPRRHPACRHGPGDPAERIHGDEHPSLALREPELARNAGRSGASAAKKSVSTRTTALAKTRRRRIPRCYPAASTSPAARSPARTAPSM